MFFGTILSSPAICCISSTGFTDNDTGQPCFGFVMVPKVGPYGRF